MVKALVTGATGCVGANIVEALLARGYEVRALRRRTSRLDALAGLSPALVTGDVTDGDSLRRAMRGCEVVFHAAAISQYWRNRPDLIYHVNVNGTRQVLQAALDSGVRRVVYTSSVAVLGIPTRRGQLLDERSPFNLLPEQFHYGHSKLLAEAEVQRFIAQGLDVVIVNPVAVIGQRDIHFVGGEILRAAAQGMELLAPPGGMGVVAARDAGLGHVLAAERGRTGERYILNGENVRHRDLMGWAAELAGVHPPYLTLPRAIMPVLGMLVRVWNRLRRGTPLVDSSQVTLSRYEMYFDGRKARQVLGFAPRSAREALREAWDWYHEHGLL